MAPHGPRIVVAALLALGLSSPSLRAQGVLDVLDGETLYEGGFLFTLGFELNRGEELRRGTRRVSDSAAQHEFEPS